MLRLARWLTLLTLVLNTPLYLLALSLTRAALSPATYHRLLDEQRLPERFRTDLARLALTKVLPLTGDDTPGRALPDLTPTEWEAIAAELFPPDWVSAQAHALVDGLFTYFA